MHGTIDQAITYFQTECGLSKLTLDSYRQTLTAFSAYLAVVQFSNLDNFTADMVSAYTQQAAVRGDAIATIRRRVATIRAFIKFQSINGRGVERLLASIDRPKAEKPLPKALSRRQVEQFIKAADTTQDKAIVELLYASGIRASELAALLVGDIKLRDGVVMVHGKGNKDRMVPIGHPAIVALRCWLGNAPANCPAFVNVDGSPLNRKTLWQRIRSIWLKSGLMQQVSPHTLRHSFASHMLSGHDAVEIDGDGVVTVHEQSGGVNLRELQSMMGHASVNTTQVYTKIDLGRLKKIHSLLGR